ncbi:unnamed protein product [Phytophthora lilii]|uniref:Unnamed protein product n=1 Tax=Phytophthora lilii TaxID=2077276 RepID=A0A9W6U9I5_9STRA|nr:unnamed protein product [Phytophthora lilii]
MFGSTDLNWYPYGTGYNRNLRRPHGDQYSDLEDVAPGQSVKSITLRYADRVDGVGLAGTSDDGATFDFFHGGGGSDRETRSLADDEYITCMEAHWKEQHCHTRIFYLSFTTSANNTISGGTKTSHFEMNALPRVTGFFGYAGQELDSVGAIWTSINPVD